MVEQVAGLITVADTAKLLGRSTEQVRRYLREGELPGRRLGGQWFIDRADAETFLLRRRDGSDFERRLTYQRPRSPARCDCDRRQRRWRHRSWANRYLRALAGDSLPGDG